MVAASDGLRPVPVQRDDDAAGGHVPARGAAVVIHKFHAGQTVRLIRGFPHRNAAEGFYQVVRQLPYGDGDYQYRIKSARELYERVVKESELEGT
jgi:hypothetical protein